MRVLFVQQNKTLGVDCQISFLYPVGGLYGGGRGLIVLFPLGLPSPRIILLLGLLKIVVYIYNNTHLKKITSVIECYVDPPSNGLDPLNFSRWL